jgi:hypothetical protein
MAGTTKKIVYGVEVDQGGGRWLSILRSEDFEYAQAFAEDARAGGSKVRVSEDQGDPHLKGNRHDAFRNPDAQIQ